MRVEVKDCRLFKCVYSDAPFYVLVPETATVFDLITTVQSNPQYMKDGVYDVELWTHAGVSLDMSTPVKNCPSDEIFH
jgi:hypothetical protein